MSTQDAGTRQDLIENGVERQLLSIRANLEAPHNVSSALQSEAEHDLIVWPREYLETYLDTGANGTIPMNEVQLEDILEAAFDRDEDLARNAIGSLKNLGADKAAATLTVSMDDKPSDRTANPVQVGQTTKNDAREFLLRIHNDPDHKMLRELLEKTTALVEERVLLQRLSATAATHEHAPQWHANGGTWDRGAFFDITSEPTVAIEPEPANGRPGIVGSLRALLRRALHSGLRENRQEHPSASNPEFRKENSEYVAEYEPDGTTVRIHDKRSAEDERAIVTAFDEPSKEVPGKIRIVTEKELDRKMDKDQSSATSAISQLSDSVNTATARTELVRQHRQVALTDSGIYSGKIISETPDAVVQRISAATEIVHAKSLFAHIPEVGQLVRIAYHNNVASVRELQERKLEKELLR